MVAARRLNPRRPQVRHAHGPSASQCVYRELPMCGALWPDYAGSLCWARSAQHSHVFGHRGQLGVSQVTRIVWMGDVGESINSEAIFKLDIDGESGIAPTFADIEVGRRFLASGLVKF